ncbi:hypothetical protein PIB30_076446 [Stylosanthes scabra]|uniref:Uncharacterized protein n=1 Tax=Stylosanthes scabra TaxID=79078 RepID=A0ABU6VRF4_9FABA|nr:hypothetical protein [Stylosanthes scabra]
MAEVDSAGPPSILPTYTVLAASAEASASSPAATVVPEPSTGATKSKKKPPATSTEKPISLEGEEGAKEDPSADLRQKRWKRKVQESFLYDAAFGADYAWEHERWILGFQGSVREAFGPVVPKHLLGTAQHYACKLTACLQVGIENAFSAKLKMEMEKELAAAKDQVAILTAKRDSPLTSPPLKAKVDSLNEQLRLAKGERLSALAQMSEVEEESKVQAVEL